jgi:hypothetical protein
VQPLSIDTPEDSLSSSIGYLQKDGSAKRDVSKTPEPAGQTTGRASKAKPAGSDGEPSPGRFVV